MTDWTKQGMIDQPLGFLNLARSYHLAAQELNRIDTGAVFRSLPATQCLLISLELYVKAWLLEDGVADDDVRGFGHDVSAVR